MKKSSKKFDPSYSYLTREAICNQSTNVTNSLKNDHKNTSMFWRLQRNLISPDREDPCLPVVAEFVESGGGVTLTVRLQYTVGYCRSRHNLLVINGGTFERLF